MKKSACTQEFNTSGYGDNTRRIWQQMEAYRNPSWDIYEKYGHVRLNLKEALKEDSTLPVKEMEDASLYFWFDLEEARSLTDKDVKNNTRECAQDKFKELKEQFVFCEEGAFEEYCKEFEREFGSSLFDELERLAQKVVEHSRDCALAGVDSDEYGFACHYILERFRSSFDVLQTEEQLIKERDAFIEANVELPCQGITRKLMEAGKITFGSNAYASGSEYPKGVQWMEPADYFAEIDKVGNMGNDERAALCWETYLTDFEGHSWRLNGSFEKVEEVSVTDFHGAEVDFSDALPTPEDFEKAPEREQPKSYNPRTAADCIRLEAE